MKLTTLSLLALGATTMTTLSSSASPAVVMAAKILPKPARLTTKKGKQIPSSLKKTGSKKQASTKAAASRSPGLWPCFDALDKRLIVISIPMIINFSITPLVGANDLFWTNRMGNALIVAGQAAATQVSPKHIFKNFC